LSAENGVGRLPAAGRGAAARLGRAANGAVAWLRKHVGTRQLRFLVARWVLSPVPAWRRSAHAYWRASPAAALGAEKLFERTFTGSFSLAGREAAFLRRYPAAAGALTADGRLRLSSTIRADALADCEVLPLAPGVLHLPTERMVLAAGRAFNPRTVRPFRYEAAAPAAGTVIPLLAAHYYHFVLDELRLVLRALADAPALRTATLLVPTGVEPFREAACDALARAYPGLEIRRIRKEQKVRCAAVAVLGRVPGTGMHDFADGETIAAVAGLYRARYGIAPGVPRRRLFVSREAGRWDRGLLNEEEVFGALRAHGFERIRPEAMDHAEQVRAFSEAAAVAGIAGAALTNLAFCPPGARVLEIRPDTFRNPIWIGLCKQQRLEHFSVEGRARGSRGHLTVDAAEIRALARELAG